MEPIPKRRSNKRPSNNPQLLQSNLSIQYQHSPLQHTSLQAVQDNSEFRRSQMLMRSIREKEAAFIAKTANTGKRQTHSQESFEYSIENSQYKQPLSYVQSSEIGFHLQDHENRDLNKNSSPLRIDPSVIDIIPTQDTEMVKYSDKLIRDNYQLRQKFTQAQQQLEKVTSETTRLQNMHDQVAGDTKQCQDEIHLLYQLQPDNGYHQQIAIARNQNAVLKAHIQQADFHRVELLKSLKLLRSKREHSYDDVDDRKRDVHHKLAVIKELEAKRAFAADKLDRVQFQVSQQQIQLTGAERIIFEDAAVINKLTHERDEIMEKLVHQNRVYQHSVQECDMERVQVIEHARYQRSILSSKVMFNTLQVLLKQRQQSAMSDFVFYCGFDRKCHRVLDRFGLILESIGHKRIQASLTKWFQTIFDPIVARDRLSIIAQQFSATKIQAQTLAVWFTSSKEAESKGLRYKKGFSRIHKVTSKFTIVDVGQRFNKWRCECKLMTKQDYILKRIIQRQFDGRRRQAMTRLQNYSWQTEALSRRQTLCVSAAHKQLQLCLMLKLKHACINQKQRRISKQRMIFKAWKDGLVYFKYMTRQKIQAVRLNQLSKVRLLAQVFWELRLSKEQEKYQMMNEKLSENVHPTITRLQNQIKAKAAKMVAMRKLRAFRTMNKFALSQIAGYFAKWRCFQTNGKERGYDILKRLFVRNYRADIHSALLQWRANSRFMKIYSQSLTVEQLIAKQSKLVSQLKKLNYKVEKEIYRQFAHKQRALKTAITIFNRRAQWWGIRKWRKLSQNWYIKRKHCSSLFERHNRTIKRRTFRQYCDKVGVKIQNDKNFQRQLYYGNLRSTRLKKKVYNAIKLYFFRFVRSRRYWSILQRTLDFWIKKRTVIRWQDQAHQLREAEIRETQNIHSRTFDVTNITLGYQVQHLSKQLEQNTHLIKRLKFLGKRVLSNCFARYYYIKAERGLNKWKQLVRFLQHRENSMKSIIHKQNKSNFYRFKASIQNFVNQSNIQLTQQQTKHVLQLTSQQVTLNTEVQRVHLKVKHQIETQIKSTEYDRQRLALKRHQIVEVIARKQFSQNYFSKRRYIFQKWVLFVRRQKQFIKQISKIIGKSLFHRAFTNIASEASSVQRSKLRHAVSIGMVRKYFNKKCAPAFSKLRKFQYEVNSLAQAQASATTITIVKAHSQFKQQVICINNSRSTKLLIKNRLENFFRAWKIVIKFLKGQRIQQQKLKQHLAIYDTVRSLLLWKQRSAVTVRLRSQLKKIKEKKIYDLKRVVMVSLKMIQQMVKRTKAIIRHLGIKVKQCRLQTAFHKIEKHTDNIKEVVVATQLKSVTELSQSLHFIHKTKMMQYWNHLQRKLLNWTHKQRNLRRVLGHQFTRRLRASFVRWRRADNYLQTIYDVEEFGPVVEEVLQQQLICNNLQAFMLDQKYTDTEVGEIKDLCQERAETLLRRAVARIQIRNVKPIVFDQWKRYVHMRKLMKYILNNLENRMQPCKADLQFSFKKWNNLFQTRKRQLIGTDQSKLVILSTKLNAHIEVLDSIGFVKTNSIVEASLNRDELFAGMISGQKLACALGRDNIQRSGHRAVALLADHSHKSIKDMMEAKLQQHVQYISKLKQQIRSIDQQNGVIAADNEQLRQSSLDGFIVGKGAQQLSIDRERLSVDLADKTIEIKQLVQTNKNLSSQLQKVLQRIESMKTHI